jgi:ureidoglycolate dehydrogenase (NAD+)
VAEAHVGVSVDRLEAFVETVLHDLSMRKHDARVAAEILVNADLRGRHTHGVWFLPAYVRMLQAGGIDPTARPAVVHETSTTAVVDGAAALGQLAGRYAAEVAIRKARAGAGIVAVLVRNSNHFGAAGYYASMCAAAGLIGIVTSNSRPITTAPGVLGPVLGSAPLAYAVPGDGGGPPIVFDGALSHVAGTRVMQAVERGEAIPEGWIVDREGRASTAPEDLLVDGSALLPLGGGHKGFGLALLVELLAGILSGAGFGYGVRSHVAHPELPSCTGHAILAVDVGAFMQPTDFAGRMGALREQIARAPRALRADPVRLPGSAADAHERVARTRGLELEAIVWTRLVRLAEQLGRGEELRSAALEAPRTTASQG